tara:strand:- start:1833 stop:2174 length:342 start_codon:yes stop_codon:yes gene_type:complete
MKRNLRNSKYNRRRTKKMKKIRKKTRVQKQRKPAGCFGCCSPKKSSNKNSLYPQTIGMISPNIFDPVPQNMNRDPRPTDSRRSNLTIINPNRRMLINPDAVKIRLDAYNKKEN